MKKPAEEPRESQKVSELIVESVNLEGAALDRSSSGSRHSAADSEDLRSIDSPDESRDSAVGESKISNSSDESRHLGVASEESKTEE